MARLTKEINAAIDAYLIDCIHAEEYDDADPFADGDIKGRLSFAYRTFKREYWHEIKRVGEVRAYASWLSGLASAHAVDFENWAILELAAKWGQPVKTEAQKDKILLSWFDFCAVRTFKLFRKYEVLEVR
jgi:hypothetical protein